MSQHPKSPGHLVECSACRARAAADDPSRLFAALAAAPLPEGLLERVSAGVAAAIDAAPRANRGRSWGALAASLALAALLGAPLLERGRVADADPAFAAAAFAAPTFTASVDVLSSPGSARVLDLSIGETKLVMIFDEAMDL